MTILFSAYYYYYYYYYLLIYEENRADCKGAAGHLAGEWEA